MFTKIRVLWHVLWGQPTVYKVILSSLALPPTSPPPQLFLFSNTFVGDDSALYCTIGGRALDVTTGDFLETTDD